MKNKMQYFDVDVARKHGIMGAILIQLVEEHGEISLNDIIRAMPYCNIREILNQVDLLSQKCVLQILNSDKDIHLKLQS